MQVDEENKNQAPIVDHADLDSDEEKERKEEEENKSESKIVFNEAGLAEIAKGVPAHIVFLSGHHAQTLFKILYSEKWTEIATGESTQKEKTETTLKIFAWHQDNEVFYFVNIETEKIKLGYVNQLIASFFSQVGKVGQIVVLNDSFKMKYPDLGSLPSEGLAIRTHKSSHVSGDAAKALFSKIGEPAHFMFATGGIGAAALIHAEFNGLHAFQATVLIEGHYVSSESMQAFAPIVEHLGLKVDLAQIAKYKGFKTVLREANNRGNSIYS